MPLAACGPCGAVLPGCARSSGSTGLTGGTCTDYAASGVMDASSGRVEGAPVAAVAAVGKGHAGSAPVLPVAAGSCVTVGPSTGDGVPVPSPGSVPLIRLLPWLSP